MIKTGLDATIMDLANKSGHRTLGVWAAECAERVLGYFEEKNPEDRRPREAILALREWVRTGEFKMAAVRGYSLNAHAAARSVNENDDAARSAARAAGQAMATAHVPVHAVAASIYAAAAVRDASGSFEEAVRERYWQYQRLIELNGSAAGEPSSGRSLWRAGRSGLTSLK